jgi:serine/threonine protein kinase
MDSRQIVGTTIAHFRILEPLASGGMASVYRALDIQLDRTVVLKILDADLLGEESARRRFLREARLASSLDHPNICTIYEIHEDKGVYYIAMQYVEGHTLKRTINARPLAAPALLSIALQVADAVARAHDRGIIHRDIKPQNIMITPRGQAKVLDFGLGKNLEEATSHASAEITALGSPFGTPAYMSPEQARGDRTDRRGDVFSFGIVLYEMATGKKPFTGKNHVDIYYAICNRTPPPILDENPAAPPGLQAIIDRCMEKDPSARYQSMHEVLSDLKRISAGMRFQTPVPDGINRPFAPVENVRRGWTNTLPGFFRKIVPGSGKTVSQQGKPAPVREESFEDSISVPDDFPLIPGLHKALAVLPFRALGSESESDWNFLLLEALVTELSKFKSLTLRPISTVARYADRAFNPNDVGRELGADGVLVGSVLRSGARVRVTAQLIETETGGVLWASKVDETLTDEVTGLDAVCQKLIEGLAGRQLGTDVSDLLQDESEEIRLDGIAMLRFSHDPKAVDALATALTDSSPRVKSAAAEALGRFGATAAPAIAAKLVDATDRGDFGTARFAAKAAGMIQSSEVLSPLLEALICDDSMLASQAALALGELGDERALPDLIESLERPDANVRFTSAQALGQLADPVSISALEIRVREDDDEGVRAKAQWAISHIQRVSSATRSRSTGGIGPARRSLPPEVVS